MLHSGKRNIGEGKRVCKGEEGRKGENRGEKERREILCKSRKGREEEGVGNRV